MSKAGRGQTPKARKRGLVVKKLPDEVLVYDLETHKAHCLNHSSALIWKHCDGRKTVAEIARLSSSEGGGLFTEEVVRLALNQLQRFALLERRAEPPVENEVLSRRELGKRLGLASLAALPLILSMETAVAAQAATCLPLGSGCITNASCCTGLCVGSRCVCMGFGSPCTVDANCCSNRCGSANNKCLP